jgi:hypothetical protein
MPPDGQREGWVWRHPRPRSSSEADVERGVTLPPSSPLCTTPSLHQDTVPVQTGAMAGECRPKRASVEAGPPNGLPS